MVKSSIGNGGTGTKKNNKKCVHTPIATCITFISKLRVKWRIKGQIPGTIKNVFIPP